MIFQDWVEWRGEKSSVVGVGHRVSGSLNNLHDKEMFLIIPGNPGLAGFYQEFMKSLHGKVGNPDLSIWALSHAGHHRPEVSWIPAEKTYGFEEQILHKLELIDRLIPQSTRITLIGHSIGCKIIMEIFKRNSTHSFTGVYFLFPTIENMVGTERGRQVYPLTTLLRIPCILILSLLYIILPKQILRTLLRRFLKDVPDSVLNTVHVLANPNYVNNCLVMAREELDTVLDLDTSTLKTMVGKLRIYYGTKDGWCPLIYRDNVLKVEGMDEKNARLDEYEIEHAFVLRSGSHLGDIIGDWMKMEWNSKN